MIELNIQGKLLSKSNSRVFTTRGHRPMLLKRPEAIDYTNSAILQIRSQLRNHVPYTRPVSIEVHVWYKSKLSDLDVSLLQDVLEKSEVYQNDRLVHVIHAFKYFDKDNPRVIVRIHEIEKEPSVEGKLRV